MTTQPAAAAFGAYSSETEPPAENRPICTFEKSKSARSSTVSSRLPKSTVLPIERSLASACTLPTGNFRCAQNLQHGFADDAGGADDGDIKFLLMFVVRLRPSYAGGVRINVGVLRAIAQVVIHEYQRNHRLGDRCCPQSDTGIVATFGDNLGFLARSCRSSCRGLKCSTSASARCWQADPAPTKCRPACHPHHSC